TSGQFLISSGAGAPPTWTSTVPATSLAWSSLTAPTANLSLAHAGYTTAFTFDSLTSASAFTLSSTSTAGGASGVSKLLDISRSGANANASHTAYGLYSAVTNTGTTSTNVGGYFSASGATNNYGLIVANGSVGIGTTAPAAGNKLHVEGQCVAMGTLIRRRRRRKKGQTLEGGEGDSPDEEIDLINLIDLISKQAQSTNDQKEIQRLSKKLGINNLDIEYLLGKLEQLEIRNSDYYWEDVPVEDIKMGDEVLTLNEETGKFEWQIVEDTMDKGMQTSYEIITESGKRIETTGNHPYLVRESFGGLRRTFLYKFDSNNYQSNGNQNQSSGNLSRSHYIPEILGVHFENRSNITANTKNSVLKANDLVKGRKLAGLEKSSNPGEIRINPNQAADKLPQIPETTLNVESLIFSTLSENNLGVNGVWTKVIDLNVGQEIATLDGFEKIISIKITGRKQMYDLQIANTHNFVAGHYVDQSIGKALTFEEEAKYLKRIDLINLIDLISKKAPNTNEQEEIQKLVNKLGIEKLNIGYCLDQLEQLEIRNSEDIVYGGIVAHNTYISGNVGIGTTGPDAKLDSLALTEQLRLTYTDGSVYSAHTVDSSGNLTIDNTGTKTIIADDLQVTGGDILDSNGNESIRFGTTASAVNEATLTNAATAGTVLLAATGGDTDVALSIDSKGADALNLNGTATGDVNLAGGYGGTGCTVTNSNGNLSCNGTITGTFAGTLPWSSIIAPTANLSLAHAGYTTAFTFDSVTTADAFALSSTSLTTGTLFDLSSTSTAGGASGVSKLLDISRSGTNANASHTAYGLYSAVTNTGTTSTNVGGYFSASGATNNYGLIVGAGNVGIGTTGPSQKLHLSEGVIRVDKTGSGSVENGLIIGNQYDNIGAGSAIQFNGSTSFAQNRARIGYVLTASGIPDFFIDVNNSEKLRITNAGNVGIGTTGPADKLSIFGGTSNINIGGNYGSGYNAIWLNGGTAATNYNFLSRAADNHLFINRPTGADIYFEENNSTTNAIIIKSGGNVGIGTVSPSSKLDVTTAGLGTTQTTSSGLALVNTTAAAADLQQISPAIRWSGFGWKTDATAASQAVDFRSYVVPVQGTAAPTGYLAFDSAIAGGAYSATPSFVITSAGNIGIGTTNPVQKLHVEGQCITGDSLLSVVPTDSSQIVVHSSQKDSGQGFIDRSSQFTEDKIQIKDVKEGTLVYSRNEETGKIEAQKINKLLDMGVKPVFKLKTESGKEIRTTGNHPYLVQLTND
ncbi:hypothetical protein GW844_04050, partial [bacterium]|nr:hypothetical protein [bacterium]